MRTPNCKCCICGKPLYRRPGDLARVRHVACMEHRNEAQMRSGITEAQLNGLRIGRGKWKAKRNMPKQSEEAKQKKSASMKAWCVNNRDKLLARAAKHSGPNHELWKGGPSRLSMAVRRLPQHRRWADAVVWRDKVCQECGADTDLEAHHVRPFAEILAANRIKNREQAKACSELWDVSNGVTLCQKCHCKQHGRTYTTTGNGRRKKPPKKRQPTKGSGNPNWKGGLVPKSCPHCGGEFHVKRSKAMISKFCSRKCKNDSSRKTV